MSQVKAKVELYNGSTLANTCTCSDVLENFKISRQGDTSKFFGFGVCQKLSFSLIDLNRQLTINSDMGVKVYLGDGTEFDLPYPTFNIKEISRNEKNNTITCNAYDRLYKASELILADINIETPYSLRTLAQTIATALDLPLKLENVDESVFDTEYPTGANFAAGGTDKLRVVLDAIAEVTQTVYFVNNSDTLVFKRLDKDGEAATTITRDVYFELNTQTPKTLTSICKATELGDNVTVGDDTGSTQFVRDNPLWELREDIATLLETAFNSIGGITITQFDCDWNGDWRLEFGDKIDLVTEDNGKVSSYVLSDTITYQGALNEITEWKYTEDETETASNPSTIGEKINQTYARVDKVNKEIELLVADVTQNTETVNQRISNIQVTTEGINASVKSLESKVDTKQQSTDAEIDRLVKEVNLKMDEDDVTILVSNKLESGVDKVTTASKKYTFDDEGLSVSSSGNNLSTFITEDGMQVYRAGQEVLTANNEGVKAEDLHATTYLIIGTTSRLEDRQNRTACYWIGE